MRPGFTLNQTWSQTLNDANNPIVDSSPNVANLDGQPSVVVGDRAGPGLRLPPLRRIGRGRLAVQRRRAGRLVPVGRPDRQRTRLGLRRHAATRPTPPPVATRPSPTRGGDQWFVQETNPGTDPTPHNGRGRLADRGQLRGRLRRGGGFARAEHRTRSAPATARCSGASRGSRPTRSSRRRRSPTSTPTATTRSSAAATRAPASPTGRPTATAATSASSRAPATRDSGNPGRRSHLRVRHEPEHRPRPRRPSVSSSPDGGVGIVDRRRELLLGGASDTNKVFALNTGCGLAWSDTLNGLTTDSPALADVTGQWAARRRRRDVGGDHLRPQRRQRRRPLVGSDLGRGDRLTGDGRPHRRRLPGRHRAHHQRHRHLRRQVGGRGGDAARRRLRLPELAPGDRRPRRPHRHHRRRLRRTPGDHGDDRALGDRQHERYRARACTRPVRGRSSTTTPS